MSDSDVFEARFRSAYRAYVTEIAAEVDAAAVARQVGTTRRALVLWTPRLTPAVVWLLLTGLIVIALAAGYLIGSNQHSTLVPILPSPTPIAGSCPPGTDPDQPGPADQARPPTFYDHAFSPGGRDYASAGIAVDPLNRLLVLPTDWTIWTLNLCTNTWRESLAAAFDGSAPVYDARSGRVVMIGGGPAADGNGVVVYDAASDTSTVMPPAPQYGSWEAIYDPIADRVIARNRNSASMFSYDAATDTWREIEQTGEMPPWLALGPPTRGTELLAYDASVDRVVSYYEGANGAATYEFDPRTSVWTREQVETPVVCFAGCNIIPPGQSRHEMAYDSGHARVVIPGMTAYDATEHRWTAAVSTQLGRVEAAPDHGFATAYDPINDRLVVIAEDQALTFDLGARTWSTLVPPQGVEP